MKFGENLISTVHLPWSQYYIDYDALKALLHAGCSSADFLRELQLQVAKAEAFLQQLWPTLTGPLERLETCGALAGDALGGLCSTLGHTREFMLLNYLATLKIAKKHDKSNPNSPVTQQISELLLGCTISDTRRLGSLLRKAEALATNYLFTISPDGFTTAPAACHVCDVVSVQVHRLRCCHAVCPPCLDAANARWQGPAAAETTPSGGGWCILLRCGHAVCVVCVTGSGLECQFCQPDQPHAAPSSLGSGLLHLAAMAEGGRGPSVQDVDTTQRQTAWLQEEVEKAKYVGWLEGIPDVVEEAVAPRRESSTTAFWRALALRQVKAERDLPPFCRGLPQLIAKGQHWTPQLTLLGHLVDDVAASVPDVAAGSLALFYVLHRAGWAVRICTACNRSPMAASPFLQVVPPLGAAGRPPVFVVDLNFAEKFHTARQTKQLSGFIKRLPAAFVGTSDDLLRAVKWCSSTVQESFLLLGMAVPPWRTPQHLREFYTNHDHLDPELLYGRLQAALGEVGGRPLNGKAGVAAKYRPAATALLRLLQAAVEGIAAVAAAESDWEMVPTSAGVRALLHFLPASEVHELLAGLKDPRTPPSRPLPHPGRISPVGEADFEKSPTPAADAPESPSNLSHLLAKLQGNGFTGYGGYFTVTM
eukprot:EG_transcript_2450